MSATPRTLLHLPPELRYRVYEFAFLDARFFVDKKGPSTDVKSYTRNFSVALTITCQFLRREITQYLTHHLSVSLYISSPIVYSHVQAIIPDCHLARVELLFTINNSYPPTEDHNSLINTILLHLHQLPQLRIINTIVWVFYLPCTNWQTAIFGVGSERMKDRMIAKAALEMFDDFEVIRHAIDHCCRRGIEVNSGILMCYGKNDLIAGYYRVGIDNGPNRSEEVWMGGSLKLEIPVPWADARDSEDVLSWLNKD